MAETALAGQSAVITGATSDIGQALCLQLAAAGARLVLLGRNRASLEQLADKLTHQNAAITIHTVDITQDSAIDSLIAQLQQQSARVDVLIHGAGEFEMGSIADADIAGFDRLYKANMRGPYRLTQSLLPLLRKTPGQIVFLNSTVGLDARKDVAQYAATQHAQRAIADSLRAEVNADGIRVLSVYLGRTATARQERIFQIEGRDYDPSLLLQPEDVAQMVLASLCLPRSAEVTEIRMRPLVKSY